MLVVDDVRVSVKVLRVVTVVVHWRDWLHLLFFVAVSMYICRGRSWSTKTQLQCLRSGDVKESP